MRRTVLWMLGLTLAVLLADQLSKWWAVGRLTAGFSEGGGALVFFGPAPEPGPDEFHFRPVDQIVFSDDFFRLNYTENPAAAFGLFKDVPERYRVPLFWVSSLAALLLVAWTFRGLRGRRDERFAQVGLALLLAGIFGNGIDRVQRGFVIDFVELHWREAHAWPAFNVADVAIIVGLVCLVVDVFVRKEPEAK